MAFRVRNRCSIKVIFAEFIFSERHQYTRNRSHCMRRLRVLYRFGKSETSSVCFEIKVGEGKREEKHIVELLVKRRLLPARQRRRTQDRDLEIADGKRVRSRADNQRASLALECWIYKSSHTHCAQRRTTRGKRSWWRNGSSS